MNSSGLKRASIHGAMVSVGAVRETQISSLQVGSFSYFLVQNDSSRGSSIESVPIPFRAGSHAFLKLPFSLRTLNPLTPESERSSMLTSTTALPCSTFHDSLRTLLAGDYLPDYLPEPDRSWDKGWPMRARRTPCRLLSEVLKPSLR